MYGSFSNWRFLVGLVLITLTSDSDTIKNVVGDTSLVNFIKVKHTS